MTASRRGRHAHHGLTGPGLPYTTLRDSAIPGLCPHASHTPPARRTIIRRSRSQSRCETQLRTLVNQHDDGTRSTNRTVPSPRSSPGSTCGTSGNGAHLTNAGPRQGGACQPRASPTMITRVSDRFPPAAAWASVLAGCLLPVVPRETVPTTDETFISSHARATFRVRTARPGLWLPCFSTATNGAGVAVHAGARRVDGAEKRGQARGAVAAELNWR